ncbi:MAG: hypothetical protein JO214_14565 [Frankiaceae bacterium]|nr:hypothetical protein [Frankiaceae bacterium]
MARRVRRVAEIDLNSFEFEEVSIAAGVVGVDADVRGLRSKWICTVGRGWLPATFAEDPFIEVLCGMTKGVELGHRLIKRCGRLINL